jgi:hypothetical protein
MTFEINKAIEILDRTPAVLHALLEGLSETWVKTNEGEGTWSPYDIVGHLIHGERTDWILRMEIILSDRADKTFEPFDRFAQMNEGGEKSLKGLLEEFDMLRKENVKKLLDRNLSANDLAKRGKHPALGDVTLRQLLATWVAHDLNHISQISRVMAKHYVKEVGPWIEYLKILKV